MYDKTGGAASLPDLTDEADVADAAAVADAADDADDAATDESRLSLIFQGDHKLGGSNVSMLSKLAINEEARKMIRSYYVHLHARP